MNKYKLLLTGGVIFRISGQECFRFLALCSAKKIAMEQVSTFSDYIEFVISYRDKDEVIQLQKKCFVEAVLISEFGLPFLLKKLKNRYFFFMGFLLSVFVWYLASQIIWQIHIAGNKKISAAAIERFLKEQNISVGTVIKRVDTELLEQELREYFPDINWVSVGFEHTNLLVQLTENETRNYEEKDNFTLYEMTAPYDCFIESIIVRNGTAMVKKGDDVPKGTVMVNGEVPIYNDDGTVRELKRVIPDADILISHQLKIEETLPKIEIAKYYTGRTHLSFKCYFRDAIFWQTKESKFRYFDQISQSVKTNKILDIFHIPIDLTVWKQREYLPFERKLTEEELEQKWSKKIHSIIKTLEEKGVQIIEKNGTMDKDVELWVYIGDWRVQELLSAGLSVIEGDKTD